MPIYEYSCEKCKATFSVLQSVGNGDKGTRCTECGSTRVKKLFSSFACSTSGSGGGTDFSGGGFSGGT